MTTDNYDVIVIGAGVTGLSATIELLGHGLRVANIESQLFGGLIININELDGAIQGSGIDFASDLMMQASRTGATILSEMVTGLVAQPNKQLLLTTDQHSYQTKAVIIATGATLKALNVPGETAFEYKGISHCADCDGPLYQDAEVVVVGGGDSAFQEALVLTEFCLKVHLIHHRPSTTAKDQLSEAVRQHEKIQIHSSCEVVEIFGTTGVEGVQVKQLTDQTIHRIACTGLFAYIGLKPSSDFFSANIEKDEGGHIITSSELMTSMQGVFAAGAVRLGYGGMLEDAIKEAKVAAQQCLLVLNS
jgi:thioredoxin reductase (NADPH)